MPKKTPSEKPEVAEFLDTLKAEPALIPRNRVAEILDEHEKTTAKRLTRGELKSVKLTSGPGSGRVLVPKIELARFLAERIA